MGQLEKEESTFLSLCSPHDRDILTGSINMTLQDFERITYLTMVLGYMKYTLDLHRRYIDCTVELTAQIDRENEILKEYPSYYLDEEIAERNQKWIDDFCDNIPADRRSYYREKMISQTELRP